MTNEERKLLTDTFNNLSIEDRKLYLDYLNGQSISEYKDFIKIIRKQAVQDFWDNERALILDGKCTRDWTPEQIERILNIDKSTGKLDSSAGRAMVLDIDGNPKFNSKGKYISYQGHHMFNVNAYPEYAGEWRNIQALASGEHIGGAHSGNTRLPTYWYYDPDLQSYGLIDGGTVDFSILDYPPKINCCFKSDADMIKIYTDYDTFSDGEKLALKYLEKSLLNRDDISGFNKALEIAENYNSQNFADKIGIISDSKLLDIYSFLENSADTDIFDLFRKYEYRLYRGLDTTIGTKVFFDADGKVVSIHNINSGIKPTNSIFEISINDIKQFSSNAQMLARYKGFDDLNDLDKIKAQYAELILHRSGVPTTGINAIDLKSIITYLEEINEGSGIKINGDFKVSLINTGESIIPVPHDTVAVLEVLGIDLRSDAVLAAFKSDLALMSAFKEFVISVPSDKIGNYIASLQFEYMINMSNLPVIPGFNGNFWGSALSDIYQFKGIWETLNPSIRNDTQLWNKLYHEFVKIPVEHGDSVFIPNGWSDMNAAALNISKFQSVFDKIGKAASSSLGKIICKGLLVISAASAISEAINYYSETNDMRGSVNILTGWGLETAGALKGAGIAFSKILPTSAYLSTLAPPYGVVAAVVLQIGVTIIGGVAGSDIGKVINDVSWAIGDFICDNFVEGNFSKNWSLGMGVITDGFNEFGKNWSLGMGVIWDSITGFFGDSKTAAPVVDPLILDLYGTGFVIDTLEDGSHFDLDGDGFAQRINWTTKNAFLCLDINGNGTIDDGSELFGDNTLIIDKNRNAINGFEALSQYDENGDGVIDEKDPIFHKLQLWIDSDGSGTSDKKEMISLKEAGIISINLDHERTNRKTDTEAIIGNVGTFIFADGRTGQIGELWVSSKAHDTIEKSEIEICEEIGGLPNVKNFGTVNSLHNAIALDKSGILQQLVKDFILETDLNNRGLIVEQILHFICNTESVKNGSRGLNIDAKKLAVIEAFMGEKFVGISGSNPNSAAASILNKLYYNLVDMYHYSMTGSMVNEQLQMIASGVDDKGRTVYNLNLLNLYMQISLESGVISENKLYNLTSYLTYYGANINKHHDMFISLYTHFKVFAPEYLNIIENSVFGAIKGDENNNTLYGTTAADVIFGFGGDDTISGGNSNDLLLGGDGADTLYGNYGNDFLDGETGNDYLDGGNGDDTYVFGLGYGQDRIYDYYGTNTIKFLEGIKPEDMIVKRTGTYDVTIYIKGTDDSLMLRGFTETSYNRDFNLEFADGTKMHASDANSPLMNLLGTDDGETISSIYANQNIDSGAGDDILHGSSGKNILLGGAGNDSLHGNAGDDILNGGTGNDTLYGNSGKDMLYGGTGNDYLNGGEGDDTYVFGLGYGQDRIYDCYGTNTLKFLEGIKTEDMIVKRTGTYDVTIYIKGTDDSLMLRGFTETSYNRDFNLEFADGTTGRVNSSYDSFDFVKPEPVTDEDIIQSNAELLSDIYAEDSITSDMLTEQDNTIISEVSDSAAVTDETDDISTQTDIQVMILAENMAAFTNEDNISDSMNILNPTEDSVMSQLLVGTQAQ